MPEACLVAGCMKITFLFSSDAAKVVVLTHKAGYPVGKRWKKQKKTIELEVVSNSIQSIRQILDKKKQRPRPTNAAFLRNNLWLIS